MKRTAKRFYAGYVDGQIPTWTLALGGRGIEIFTNKRTARKSYEDVRLIEIREVGKSVKARKARP